VTHKSCGGAITSFEYIRPVIEAMADLVCCHGLDPDSEGFIREMLIQRGFSLELVRAAEAWCDQAAACGQLIEALSLFVPHTTGTRVSSPLERLSVSERMWKSIESCRNKGFFSEDLAERLLEGARAMDTRDWDDEEVCDFIENACAGRGTTSSEEANRLRKAIRGHFSTLYC
jgi:hypothetical protein